MKINFLGDSITEGAGASDESKTFVSLVARALDIEVVNYGIGGTRIARQKQKSEVERYDLDFQMRVKEMSDADFVVVFGGTNDWGHGDAPIGNEDDTDPYTFYGGLNNLIKDLDKKYGKEKLLFILPIHRYLEENPYGEGNKKVASLSLGEYVSVIRSVLDRAGIEYLNLYDEGLPVPSTNANEGYFFDGVHPNDKGHEFLAKKIAEALSSRL